ncbi:hypothetical protein BJX61DRAFT_517451 [Aspergillus egyptiacus]|nr:hypothetical protein BJX61DRAFT_517451 [Aspergillus egyptiacus]
MLSFVIMSQAWLWHFVSVSEAEKQQRRDLLTLRGYYAQLSILLAIVLLRLYSAFLSSKHQERRGRKAGGPRQKSYLDSPLFTGWFETRRQYLLCLFWLSWLLGLSVWGTGDGMQFLILSHPTDKLNDVSCTSQD